MANYEYELNRIANAIEEQNFKLDLLCMLFMTKISYESGIITEGQYREMCEKMTSTMYDHAKGKAEVPFNIKQW